MAWHTLADLSPGDKVTADNMDNIREDIEYLYKENGAASVAYSAGNISAAAASFSSVPNLSLVITANGGPLLMGFNSQIVMSAATLCLDVAIDGTGIGGNSGVFRRPDTHPEARTEGTAMPIGFTLMQNGISAGTHTVALQIKSTNTATIISDTNNAAYFWAAEL